MNLPTSIENSRGEKLSSSFHPGQKDDCLLILGHGVTGNKDRPLLVALAEGLAALGWPCLRVSYSGNGDSEGRFEDSTISKEIADLQSIMDAIPGEIKIAYCGHSMGGAVGVQTSVRDERVRVLVSLAGMVQTKEFYEREFADVIPGQGTMWDEASCPLSQAYVDDLTQIGSLLPAAAAVEVPWLLIHGSDDDVVPSSDTDAAYEVAAEPKMRLIIDGAGHSFGDEIYPQIIKEIDLWLGRHLP